MHSDVYEMIWVKLCMMIDAIELNILMQVFVTLTLIRGNTAAR